MHIQTYNRYKFQEDNCKALNSSMGMCVTQQPGHTGADEQEPEWLRVCPVAVPAWGQGEYHSHRVPSPVLGSAAAAGVGGSWCGGRLGLTGTKAIRSVHP